MWLWICMSFVVKKDQVKTNVFSFEVNSKRGRVLNGSLICDYTTWFRSSSYDIYTLYNQDRQPSGSGQAF